MTIIIATVSILAIAGIALAANKILKVKICPICAGVSGTWIWMLLVNFFISPIDLLVPAMLMGGTVVGLAYQGEKRLSPDRSPLLWKILFIPAGFVAVYSLISEWWVALLISAVFMATVYWLFAAPRIHRPADRKVEELEKKMEKCC